MELGQLFLCICVQDWFNHSTSQTCFLDLSVTYENESVQLFSSD